jgi:iron complex outermembrane receptor protein
MTRQWAGAVARLLGRSSAVAIVFVGAAGAGTSALAQDVAADQGQQSGPARMATPSGTPSASEIVVTGSRIIGLGFNSPTPVTVIGNDRIERLAVTDIGEALNQIPSFRATLTPETTADGTPTNIAQRVVDLRGLGAARTLVLVDGRRFVPSNTQGTVDLNSIPTNLVQRVEVVTGGASAAYGADAVAGVVNFILDTKFSGLVAQGSYGQADAGDKETAYITLKAGQTFADGRGHILFGGEFLDDKGTGDCFSRVWCRRNTNVMANPDPSNGQAANLMLANLFAVNSTHGLIISGAATGTTFTDAGTPRPFRYGQLPNGIFMIGGESDGGKQLWLEGFNISPRIQRYNGLAHLDYEFSPDFQAFVEGSYAHVSASSHQIPPIELFQPLSVDYAYLPASIRTAMVAAGQTSFLFNRQDNDLGVLNSRSKDDTYRATVGFKGALGGSWRWDGYYQYGRHDNDSEVRNNRINANWAQSLDAVIGPNGKPVCRSTIGSPGSGCVPVNLIGVNNWDPAVKQWAYGTSTLTRHLTEHVLSGNLSGSVPALAAGPLSVATGVEYRHDRATGAIDTISAAQGWWNNSGTPITGSISVLEGYVEAELPLLKDVPFARSLSLNAALRETHYNTSGWVTTWKAGALWDVVDAFRLRATRSRDIRAPNMDELFGPENSHPTILVDPRNNTQVFVNQHQGGNPNLDPERGDTWTVGAVLQPQAGAFRGFHASVDYYDIKVRGAIDLVNPQTILDRCGTGDQQFCSFVARDARGAITDLDVRYINLNRLSTNGVEVAMSYRLPTTRLISSWDASFDLNLLANYVAHLKLTDSSGSTIDRAGQTGIELLGTPGQPHWTLDGVVSYTQGPATLTVQEHFVSAGIFDADRIGPEQAGYNPLDPRSINRNRVSSRFYTNLAGQFVLFQQAERRVELFGAVQNLFDKQPPFLPGGHNPIFFDNIGRQYTAGVRVRM